MRLCLPLMLASRWNARQYVWHVVEKAAIRAGIETYEENGVTRSKVSPHWLRHAHASHFLQRNGDLMTLRDTLGWADFKMASRTAMRDPTHLVAYCYHCKRAYQALSSSMKYRTDDLRY